jgi:plastocyanin
MTRKWIPPVVVIAAALTLLAFGCSSNEAGVVLETGASSDTTAVAETPEPTDEPSLDESFAHDDDTAAEHSDDKNTAAEDETTDHSDQNHETTEPEAAEQEDEQISDEDEPDSESEDDGAILVVMNEFGYIIDQTEFALGATVTFEFTNEGAIEHEAMFGSALEQEEFHADTDHGGAGHHGDVAAITLGAGESRSLTMTFEEPGEMVIGCHLLGHWEAGMATTLTVA